MPFEVDGTADENWKQVLLVRRFLKRELTQAEEDEVLRVGLNAEFFQKALAEQQR